MPRDLLRLMGGIVTPGLGRCSQNTPPDVELG
jgi:hypothetical protein